MKKFLTEKLFSIIIIFIIAITLSIPSSSAFADEKHSDFEPGNEEVMLEKTGVYGMTPIFPSQVKNGTYENVQTDSSSTFFTILSSILYVDDGHITADMNISSKSYLYLYPGSAEEASKAGFESYIPLTEKNGLNTFTFPVSGLNQKIRCAAFSKKKEKWYDRYILFRADSMPEKAFDFQVPDYDFIEQSIIKNGGVPEKKKNTGASNSGKKGLTPAKINMPDGEYSIELNMTGGSGKVTVSSPAWFYVKDGKAYAKFLLSSKNYDFIIAGGKKYKNESDSGGSSCFTIPVSVFDSPIKIIGNTTAMDDPMQIKYQLTFFKDSIDSKTRIPQESAKTVIITALAIILVGGILNHFVKKKRHC